MPVRDWLPPAMIAAGLLAYITGALDRLGLEGAGQGLGIGALICAPIWLVTIWRRNKDARRDED